MTLSNTEDNGGDISKGDFVWIRFKVLDNPTIVGDTPLQFLPRPGYDEYGAKSVNAVFIRREPRTRFKRLLLPIVDWLLR